MNANKGLWKTGVLALVATLIFGMFIYRAGDWAKGLNSEFVVYGQQSGGTGGTGGTGGATGTAPAVTSTKVIP